MKNLLYMCALALLVAAGCKKSEEGHADERVVQPITCMNNLKQIGLAFRIWEGDHGDQYPFNVSTNAGGALELCSPDKDGFDRNAWLYLKTMTNDDELTVPLLLICPRDRSQKPAASWKALQATNVTYRFRCGTNITDANPKAVLAICPIDGNILYTDGTVVPGNEASKKEIEHLMQVR
jgi:hypothetical protein